MPTLGVTSIAAGLNNLGSVAVSSGILTVTFVVDRTAGATPLNSLTPQDRLTIRVQISYDGGTTWTDTREFAQFGGGSEASFEVLLEAWSPTNANRRARFQADASIAMTIAGQLTLA